jgi:GT2 family glycosyltransferase
MGLRASLIIPSYGRQAFLQETVGRFLNSRPESDWELLVVDQTPEPSPDLRALSESRPTLRYLHIDTPGLPNARNVGIREARGEIVLFVDDDVVPDEGFLEAHLTAYADPQVGGVAGRIVEALERPKMWRHTGGVGQVRLWDGRITRHFETTRACDVDFAPGGNMSYRRQILLDIAGFDRRYGGTAHMEEVDVSLRVTARGWRIRFEPDASLTHLSLQVGGCRELDLARWLYWYGHNYLLFACKNLPRRFLPLFVAERVLKLLITGLRHLRPAYTTRGLAGLRDGWASSRTDAAPL